MKRHSLPIARRILAWAMYAFRPVTVSELSEALDFEDWMDSVGDGSSNSSQDEADSDEEIEINNAWIDNEVLSICGSLLDTQASKNDDTPGSRTIRLVHFSVRDFLSSVAQGEAKAAESSSLLIFTRSAAQLYLAKSRLGYLNSKTTWEKRAVLKTGVVASFLDYAAESWHLHVSATKHWDNELQSLVRDFLQSSNENFISWRQHFESSVEKQDLEEIQPNREVASPLYNAAMFGLLYNMQSSKEQWLSTINSAGGRYGTALQATFAEGESRDFRILMDWSPNVSIPGGEFGSAINAAAARGDKKMVMELVTASAELDPTDNMGRTAFYMACRHRHYVVVKYLFDNKVDITRTDKYGWTPLRSASFNGHLEVVKFLVEKGVELLTLSNRHGNALHSACENGHREIVRVLSANNKAAVKMRDRSGRTPLSHAAVLNNLSTFNYLLGLDQVEVEAEDYELRTPLSWAAQRGDVAAVETLLRDARVNPNIEDSYGRSPLMWAAISGQEANMTVLSRFVNPKLGYVTSLDLQVNCVRDRIGCSIVHFLSMGNCISALKQLLAKQEDNNTVDNQNWTALHWAVYFGHVETTKLLIEHGADVHARDWQHWNTYELAIFCGAKDVIEVLEARTMSAIDDTREQGTVLRGWCSCCFRDFVGYRYHCKVCADYDLCFRCIRDANNIHPPHEFHEDSQFSDL